MKVYNKNKNVVINGEHDLCLGYKRDVGVSIGDNVNNISFENWTFTVSPYVNKFKRKIWGIIQVIKYF